MLAVAGQPLKAMLLVGINAGFGNGDVSSVTIQSVDQATGWLTFPRSKTGIDRRVPLWPETVTAIRDWLAVRPERHDPKHADLLFITSKHGSWHDETGRPLSHEMRKLLDKLSLDPALLPPGDKGAAPRSAFRLAACTTAKIW
jgi:integrase